MNLAEKDIFQTIGLYFSCFVIQLQRKVTSYKQSLSVCLCMGDLQAPAAPHFVFLITQ